jgi:hypothetical protein
MITNKNKVNLESLSQPTPRGPRIFKISKNTNSHAEVYTIQNFNHSSITERSKKIPELYHFLNSWASLKTHFLETFASKEIQTLKQTTSAVNYVTKFQQSSADLQG